VDTSTVEAALDDIRPALQADGFELLCESIDGDGVVSVGLQAKPDACLDCLVPDDMLVQIIESSIRDRTADFSRVVLTKHGFDAIADH
jgi:Fe-S cluster biogenesis protein NfuA